MKPRTLVILVVVLAALAALVWFRQQQAQPPRLAEEVQLKTLLPENLRADDVARLELYAGAKPEEKVVLAREGDNWVAQNKFNAPVQSEKITDYLQDLAQLEGEFRATAGEEALTDYALDETAGFHVVGYQTGAESPAFHLVVGKSPRFGNAFVRAADAQDVYIANVDFRQEAGVYDEARETAPTADTWLDKTVLTVDQPNVTRVALKMPDKQIVLEKQEVPAEPQEPAEEGAEAAPPPVPETKWVVTDGGYAGAELKDAGVTSLLNKFANLSATDIEDPAKKAEFGLDDPQYRAEVAVDGADAPVVLVGARPEAGGPGYVQLADSESGLIYKVDQFGFDQLFPKGTQLFDLPSLNLNTTEMARITYSTPETEVVLENTDDGWNVAQPAAAIPELEAKLSSIASALAMWRADDYAGNGVDAGLENPAYLVEFTTKDGAQHSLAIGNEAAHSDGRYTRLDGGSEVLVTKALDMDKIFVAPKDLYDRGLFDVLAADVNAVQVSRGEEEYQLARAETGWQLTVGGEERPADEIAAEDMVTALANLQADDLQFGDAFVLGGVMGTVQFTTEDGAEYQMTAYIAQDGLHPVSVSGKDGVRYLVPAEELESAAPPADALVVQEETAAPEATEDAAAEAGEPTAETAAPETDAGDVEAPEDSAAEAGEPTAETAAPESDAGVVEAPEIIEETAPTAPAPN